MKKNKHLFELDQGESKTDPVTRIQPTEDSLSVAQSVADDLDIQMDKEKTRILASNLLGAYFIDIIRVIDIDDPSLVFDHFVSSDISAYSGFTVDQKPIIFFDQNLDNWLFSIYQVLAIRAFFILSDDVRKDTNNILTMILRCLKQPDLHLEIRDRLRPYIAKYPNALPVVNCLTMTTNAFIICHEIAHYQLNHDGSANDHNQEYQADQTGYEHLLALSKSPEKTQHLKITPNFLCSPCLLMHCLDLAERFFARESGTTKIESSASHPLAEKRLIALQRVGQSTWGTEALDLYNGFKCTIDELADDLELTPK